MPFYYFSLSLSLCFSPLSLTALCFDEPSDIKQRKGRENTKITKKTGKIESNGTVRDIPLPPPNRKRRRRRRREKKKKSGRTIPEWSPPITGERFSSQTATARDGPLPRPLRSHLLPHAPPPSTFSPATPTPHHFRRTLLSRHLFA